MSLLAARGIVKQYPGTRALDGVDFEVEPGQVSALIGENGAGKSTLMKILAGIEQPTGGRIELDGRSVSFASPREAAASGIAIIHQELNLLPNLTVAENIFLGREITRHGVIDRKAQEQESSEWLEKLGQPFSPVTLVGDLPVGQQQIVEIARALAQNARVLIMDEPTSALSAAETDALFQTIGDLKAHGIGMVYISHRLEELLDIGDSVTVLRDGRVVACEDALTVNVPWLVEKMTGRAAHSSPAAAAVTGPRSVLDVDFPGATFSASAGEIVGIYGLMGAGRTELFESIIGLRPAAGVIRLEAIHIEHLPLQRRVRSGLVLVPEDRQRSAILANLSVGENITIAGPWLSPARQQETALEAIRNMRIRTTGPRQPVTSLSGGNQQKVILSRALAAKPKVLLLDEPTRGVDVGAREEIFEIIRRMARSGVAIVFASSEIEEVQALATRVLVMAGGRITAGFTRAEATPDRMVAASAPSRRIA